jgi:hypothetical protein
MKRPQAIAAKSSLPVATTRPLKEPTALACLRCQLLGRRRLLCSRVDQCKEIPHVGALGPVLLLGLLAMLVAFIIAIL